jgi:adenylosuccinate lyase
MGKKVELDIIEKIVKMRNEGKKFREISEVVGYTTAYVVYIYNNRHTLIRRYYGISDDIDKILNSEEMNIGTKQITFNLPEQDYGRYAKIKYEIIKKMEMGTDEYVFIKLLDAYDELKRIKEKEQEYLDYLKHIGFEVIEK